MENLNVSNLIEKMVNRGIKRSTIEHIEQQGINYQNWLGGFDSIETAIIKTMEDIHSHPLIPNDIKIEGILIDSHTGKLSPIHSIEAIK